MLKPGASYIIIHNTSPVLCNGTRVLYHRRVGRTLEVEVVSGVHQGELHYVPRLVLISKEASIPFTLKRVQYPLQPCFAMYVRVLFRCCLSFMNVFCYYVVLPCSYTCRTVHKSQGQTLDRVGIFFARDVWAHGLLYVAVSRVRRQQNCFFLGVVGATVHNVCCALLR